jgi:integrase/recombinase XerD
MQSRMPPQLYTPAARYRRQWRTQIDYFCDVWLCAANRAKKTQSAYRADLRQFAESLPGSVGLQNINRVRVEKWIADLQCHSFATATIRRKIASLRAFFSYLTKIGHMRRSPLANIQIRLGGIKRLTRIVPRGELRELIRTADRQANKRSMNDMDRVRNLRNAVMVRLLCATGMRVGELVSLRLSDVDAEGKSLTVHGKGNRERLAFVTDPHTVTLMKRFLKRRRRGSIGQAALFASAGNRPLTTDMLRKLLKSLCKLAGTTSRITPHMLRHTAATLLLTNGADLRIVQEFLGHDSIRSTERYTHIARDHLVRVLRWANPLKNVA